MNDMSKFQRSWLLFKSSINVIFRNKQLLVFPIVIFALTLVITLFFVAPVVLRPTGYGYGEAEHWKAVMEPFFVESHVQSDGSKAFEFAAKPAAIVYGAVLYIESLFLPTFFNVAFTNEVIAALSGNPVLIGRGLRFACTKLKTIFLWTLFAGVVGLLIKAMEEKLDFVGRFVVRLIGIAWSVASVFAVPVIVRDETAGNPLAVLRKSAQSLRKTWGETLIGYVGLTFGNLLVGLASFFLLGGALFLSIAADNYWVIAVVGILWVAALFLFAYITSVASQVYRGALYLYAAEGIVPDPYSKQLLDMAWKFKKA